MPGNADQEPGRKIAPRSNRPTQRGNTRTGLWELVDKYRRQYIRAVRRAARAEARKREQAAKAERKRKAKAEPDAIPIDRPRKVKK